MYFNPQYDYDYGPDGVLAPLQERTVSPDFPVMISPPLGWVPLVLELNEAIAALLPDYSIAQVKEKFAGLRYYIGDYGCAKDDPRVKIVNDLVHEAEAASMSICQVCGEPGTLRDPKDDGGRYYGTFCDAHRTGRLDDVVFD